tara:strand:+ start:157 stop:834 length:678 start_codon:yes stop_codon:yes gene_type:complete
VKSFRSFITDSVDAEKEYGKSFVASAKSVGVQRKLTKELGVKLKEVEKSLGHGGGGNGLTPDDVKSNPKWKAAKKALDVAFKKEQQMNQAMSKAFGKQMKDFRNKDRRGYISLFIGESTEACCEDCVEELIVEDGVFINEDGKKDNVKLNNPTRGGSKKFYVYVKNDKGNVVKVSFGDPDMEIKRDDPARRKSFRARHNCADPGPKWKARYWSCYQWRAGAKVDN